jgi:hypothetical protein
MLAMGLPVGAGTDATRVASHNPWVSLYWLVTGKTVGGLSLYSQANRQDRMQALKLYTAGSAWFSGEEDRKGTLTPGQFADLAVLSADYLSVPGDEIRSIQSVLTVVGGKIVHGGREFTSLAPEPVPPMPDWSPVGLFGGYHDPARSSNLLGYHTTTCPAGSGFHALLHRLLSAKKTCERTSTSRQGCACWAF